MAVYLGAEPSFSPTTVWYNEIIHDYQEFGPLNYDPDNGWLKRHLGLVKEELRLAGEEFLIAVPDLIESMDILSALRGPRKLCLDLMDHPEIVKDYISQIDNFYFRYYDSFYDLVKDGSNGCCYTSFQIWGSGKTAKVQCDYSAMISPYHFREFALPFLKRHCDKLDFSLYHLDGPDAIKHTDAIVEIDALDALQFTPGTGRPDPGNEQKGYPLSWRTPKI